MSTDEYENITIWDVYVTFRSEQSKYLSRPYRLPKDFDYHLKKMSSTNKESLEKISRYFNTVWQSIDPHKYFANGFELFGKKFSYSYFFDRRLINFYKERDKNQKRELSLNKKSIVSSFKYIKTYMSEKNTISSKILAYANLREDNISIPVLHHVKGKIDKYTLVWIMSQGYLTLTENDKNMVPYIMEKYRTLMLNVRDIRDFMEKAEKAL